MWSSDSVNAERLNAGGSEHEPSALSRFFYAVFASERTNAVFSKLNTQTECTTSTYTWLNINIFEKPRISGLTSWQQPVKLWYCIIMGKIRIFRRRHVRKHRLTLWIPHFLRGTAAQGTRRQRIPQAGLRPHSMRHSEMRTMRKTRHNQVFCGEPQRLGVKQCCIK